MSRLLILRHAERPTIPDGEDGADLAITVMGRKAAHALGSRLGERPLNILTSPIRRCVETAEEIARGADFNVGTIKHSQLLGAPGVFIENDRLAWRRWTQIGHEAVCREVVTSCVAAPGFRNPDNAVAILKSEIASTLALEQGITIWVTHDIILAATAHRLCRFDAFGRSWPDFLGCLSFDRAGDGWALAKWMPLGLPMSCGQALNSEASPAPEFCQQVSLGT